MIGIIGNYGCDIIEIISITVNNFCIVEFKSTGKTKSININQIEII